MQNKDILQFKDKHKVFSNFYPCIISLEGLNFPTLEHAYVSTKSQEFFFKRLISLLPAEKAGTARTRGRNIRLRSDWSDELKLEIMIDLCSQKYKQEFFRKALNATGSSYLEEGNFWHDNFWGNCLCSNCKDIKGQNNLGRIIMDLRTMLL